MASKQVNTTITAVIVQIVVDPVNGQLYLQGALQAPAPDGSGQVNVAVYQENVTAQMNQADIDAATQLIGRAQAWIDAKLP